MQSDVQVLPSAAVTSLRAKLIVFAVNLGVVTLAYYPLTTPHFATDSYAAFYDLSPATPASLGRLLTALLAIIFERAHYFPIQHQSIYTWLMIVATAFCATVVTLRLRGELGATQGAVGSAMNGAIREVALVAGVLIAFVNVALLEWFLFPEVILYFALALTLSVVAFEVWARQRNNWGLLATCALLFAALNFYQAALGFFVILALTTVIVRHRSQPTRAAWMEGLEVAAIGAVCALANLTLTQLGQWSGLLARDVRNPGVTLNNLRQSVEPVVESIVWAWDGFFGLMPPYVVAGTVLALAGMLLVGAVLRHIRWSQLVLPVAALVLGVAVIFAPHLITAAVWVTPRSIAPIFALLTILVTTVLLLSERAPVQLLAGIVAAGFVVISIWQIHAIVQSHSLHNRIEQREARTIVDEIEEHERQTGSEVRRVGIVLDAEPNWTYPEVEFVYRDLNARAMTRTWSDLALLHYVSGRHFARAEVDGQKREQLLEKHPNWLEFDADDQVSFEGDTAYIVVY